MLAVTVTEFRKHLQAYLKLIQDGDEIQLTNRGKIIARIIPEEDEAETARRRLFALRGKGTVGDVVSPFEDVEWSTDADNL